MYSCLGDFSLFFHPYSFPYHSMVFFPFFISHFHFSCSLSSCFHFNFLSHSSGRWSGSACSFSYHPGGVHILLTIIVPGVGALASILNLVFSLAAGVYVSFFLLKPLLTCLRLILVQPPSAFQ